MAEQNPTTEQETAPELDALGMSDDEFASMDPSQFEQEDLSQYDDDFSSEETSDDSTFDQEEDTDTDEENEDQDDGQPEAGPSDSDTEEEDDTPEADEDTDETDDTTKEGDADEDGASDEESEEADKEDDQEESEVDFKSEYEKLMAPFKANGREMQVRNADEARRLMQMGANYNKKMAAIKPSLKTVKLLDKHGLNDQEKLSHLIDLSKGDKGAIQKLLKDSNVDPLDLDSEEESNYRPNTYDVDDREMELDEVLETLQDTPTFNQTLGLVRNKWDDASKQTIADNPRVLEVLNSHMANGIYERVSTEVERQRALGELTGVSDIEAYKQVGDRMAEEGAFNDLAQDKPASTEKPEPKPAPRKTRRKAPDPERKQKKRAVSSTKTKPASKSPSDFNPLGMSDEEFEKQFDPTLL